MKKLLFIIVFTLLLTAVFAHDMNVLLLDAAAENDVKSMDTYIFQGADINTRNMEGYTPLLIAVLRGNYEAAYYLVRAGADLEISSPAGFTPLMIASMRGYSDIAKLLIDNNANVNAELKRGLTALMLAAGKGEAVIVTMLLDAGADPQAEDDFGLSAMELVQGISDELADASTVIITLDEPEEVAALGNTADNEEDTVTAEVIRVESVDSIDESEINLGPADDVLSADGGTMEEVSLSGTAETEDEGAADVTAEESAETGMTEVSLDSAEGYTIDDVNDAIRNNDWLLLDAMSSVAGLDPNQLGSDGVAPVHLAVTMDLPEVITFLAANGGDLELLDSTGRSPMYYAVSSGNDDIINLLIENGVDMKTDQSAGDPLLFSAVKTGDPNIVDLVLSAGVDVNEKNNKGMTVLMAAAEDNNFMIVQLLVSKGHADPSITHSSGMKAADYAEDEKIKTYLNNQEGGA